MKFKGGNFPSGDGSVNWDDWIERSEGHEGIMQYGTSRSLGYHRPQRSTDNKSLSLSPTKNKEIVIIWCIRWLKNFPIRFM